MKQIQEPYPVLVPQLAGLRLLRKLQERLGDMHDDLERQIVQGKTYQNDMHDDYNVYTESDANTVMEISARMLLNQTGPIPCLESFLLECPELKAIDPDWERLLSTIELFVTAALSE